MYVLFLLQSGFGFTSSTVLNNLKEAPIPKLEFNELPLMKPAVTMANTDVSSSTTMCSLPPTVSTACPPLNLQSSNLLNPVVSTVTAEFASKSTTPIAPHPNLISTIPNLTINALADNISLLDLDMPSSTVAASKTYLPSKSTPLILNENNSLISDKNSSVDNTSHNATTSFEFGKNSVKSKSFNIPHDYLDVSKNKNVEETLSTPLSDDLFGDFQSVDFSLGKNDVKDDIEFDDFKSADFTTLNLLEVKEKPPEIKPSMLFYFYIYLSFSSPFPF